MIKEKTVFEKINNQLFKIKLVEPENLKQASFTHYLNNSDNTNSKYFKKNAVDCVKEVLSKETNNQIISDKTAEEALQYLE